MVLADLKKFDAAMAIIYVISIFVTLIGILVLIAMIIGNNTFLGKNYKQINDKVSSLVQKNVLSEEEQEEIKNAENKKAYLYGHPWLMIILVLMTSVTAIAYIIKGLLYILSQHHENELKKQMLECIKSR